MKIVWGDWKPLDKEPSSRYELLFISMMENGDIVMYVNANTHELFLEERSPSRMHTKWHE